MSIGAACVEESPPEQLSAFERDLAPQLLACTACHNNTEAPEGGLNLTDLNTLTDIPSQQMDMMLIEPGNHLRSYLWHKVNGTQSIAGGLGQRMPIAHAWSEENVTLLGQWIDLGLPE